MAEFSGPLTIRLAGEVQGIRPGTFTAEYRATASLSGMRVDYFGMLSGSAWIAGDLTVEFTEPGGLPVSRTDYSYWTQVIYEPLATFSLNLGVLGDHLGFANWSTAATFGANTLSLPLDGAGSFDTGWYNGTRILGTATSAGRTSLVGTLYSVAPLEPTVLEGDAGATPVTFRVTRISPDGAPSSVGWQIDPDFAVQRLADGAPSTGRIDFARDQTEALLTIGIRADTVFASDWPLTLSLWQQPGIQGTPQESLFGNRTGATVTVLNDDVMRQVGIVAVDADKPEGNTGAVTPFTFRVFRTGGDLSQPLPVEVDIQGQYWTHPHYADTWDFADPSNRISLTIPAGAASAELVLNVRADTDPEPSESFVVSIWQFGTAVDGPNPTYRQAVGRIEADDPHPQGRLFVADSTTGLGVPAVPEFYDGPVFGPTSQYVRITPENLSVAVSSPGWFIRTGAGNDAIVLFGWNNVVDAGPGSNFITWANPGNQAIDLTHVFIDARGLQAPAWSTFRGMTFTPGTDVTIWGISAADTTLDWIPGLGAPGYEGLTLLASAPGRPLAAVTLAQWGEDLLPRISTHFGHDTASGSDYLLIQAS